MPRLSHLVVLYGRGGMDGTGRTGRDGVERGERDGANRTGREGWNVNGLTDGRWDTDGQDAFPARAAL